MPPPTRATVIFSSVPQKSRSNLLYTAVSSAASDDVSEPESRADEQTDPATNEKTESSPSESPQPAAEEAVGAVPSAPAPPPAEQNGFLPRPSAKHSAEELSISVISELKALDGKSLLRSPGAPRPPRPVSNGIPSGTSTPDTVEDEVDCMAQIPEIDGNGRQVPAWKRQLMARRKAEELRVEREERARREKEEHRLASMPRWKRELEARKAQGKA